MSIRAASRHHGLGWHRIMGLVSAEVARVAERRRALLVKDSGLIGSSCCENGYRVG